MIKRIILGFILLFLFTSKTYAIMLSDKASGTIQSEILNPQIIISYEKDYSPDEINAHLNLAKSKANTLFGYLNDGILKLFGRETEVNKLKSKLLNIESAYKEANVYEVRKLDTIEKISPNTYLLVLKSGSDVSLTTERLMKIPGVMYALPNTMFWSQTGIRIQSEDYKKNLPVQLLVKYKEGQAPEQLVREAEQANSSVFGRISRIAQDVTTGQTGERSPEKKLERIRAFFKKNNYRYSQYVYRTRPTTGPLANTQIVTFSDSTSLDRILEEYKKLPEVEAVIPNFMMFASLIPNDPNFPQLWGMQKIEAPGAWDKSTGSESVTVAVIDTGVDYNHPDLSGRVTKGMDFSTCDDTAQESLAVGPGACLNPKQPDNDPMDDSGHGTHVAGTVGAIGNNSIGVTGVNWKVNILAIKVLGKGGGGPFSGVLSGIQYAVDNGAKIINLSLGMHNAMDCSSTRPEVIPFKNAIEYARSRGTLVVVAAGNDNSNAQNDIFASCAGVLAVGATAQNDTRASFSNYGTNITISAPGVNILSTIPSSTNLPSSCQKSGIYASCPGTSMATPHVAGAAGLLLSMNPNITPDQIKDYLVKSADPITTDRPIGPRLNLAKAADLVLGPGDVNPNPTVQPTNIISPNPTTQITNPAPTGVTPAKTTPAPTAAAEGKIIISVILPGIGIDNFENNNPQKGQRKITLVFTNSSSDKTTSGMLSYENGTYTGSIPAPLGTYQIAIKLDNTLLKRVPGIYKITPNDSIRTQAVVLVPGDLNGDGFLDIFDYNIMIRCVTVGCGDTSVLADLNDDGVANPADLNIMLRQFTNRSGD